MPYITVKRIVESEILIVAESWMPLNDAQQRMGEISQFPGQLDRNAEGIQGEIWIEVEDDQRGLHQDGVLVCFPPENAQQALVQAGMEPTEAARILSADYARQRRHLSVPVADFVRVL